MGCQAGLSGTFAPQRLDQMVAPHGHPDMLGRQVIVNLVHIGDKEFGVDPCPCKAGTARSASAFVMADAVRGPFRRRHLGEFTVTGEQIISMRQRRDFGNYLDVSLRSQTYDRRDLVFSKTARTAYLWGRIPALAMGPLERSRRLRSKSRAKSKTPASSWDDVPAACRRSPRSSSC